MEGNEYARVNTDRHHWHRFIANNIHLPGLAEMGHVRLRQSATWWGESRGNCPEIQGFKMVFQLPADAG